MPIYTVAARPNSDNLPMISPALHLVALNVPYPPTYGGIIDIYYKICALHHLGVRVHLHVWQYESPVAPHLETLCERVYYYPRRVGLLANVSLKPYNVVSRTSETLRERLLRDPYPILYEGLHTTFCIDDRRLMGRIQAVRMHNIEHRYYAALARVETTCIGRAFHLVEALRLRWYEPCLRRATHLIAVSHTESQELSTRYPEVPVHTVPCFHPYDRVTATPGRGDYLLYHAKLSVSENAHAAMVLIETVLSHLPYRSIIAGMNPPEALVRCVARYEHITLVPNPSAEEMAHLIAQAQIHVLYTEQATGLKLKLLGALYAGRHVVVNPAMVAGSGLDALCHVAEDAEAMRHLCTQLMACPMTQEDLAVRHERLAPLMWPRLGRQLVEILFPDHYPSPED